MYLISVPLTIIFVFINSKLRGGSQVSFLSFPDFFPPILLVYRWKSDIVYDWIYLKTRAEMRTINSISIVINVVSLSSIFFFLIKWSKKKYNAVCGTLPHQSAFMTGTDCMSTSPTTHCTASVPCKNVFLLRENSLCPDCIAFGKQYFLTQAWGPLFL